MKSKNKNNKTKNEHNISFPPTIRTKCGWGRCGGGHLTSYRSHQIRNVWVNEWMDEWEWHGIWKEWPRFCHLCTKCPCKSLSLLIYDLEVLYLSNSFNISDRGNGEVQPRINLSTRLVDAMPRAHYTLRNSQKCFSFLLKSEEKNVLSGQIKCSVI